MCADTFELLLKGILPSQRNLTGTYSSDQRSKHGVSLSPIFVKLKHNEE